MNYKNFGVRMKLLKSELGLNQKEFAKAIEISPSKLSQYETGKYLMKIDVAIKINNIFNVSLDWLFLGKGEIFIENNEDINITGDINKSAVAIKGTATNNSNNNELSKEENEEIEKVCQVIRKLSKQKVKKLYHLAELENLENE